MWVPYSQEFAFTYILPIAVGFGISILLLSFGRVRKIFERELPTVTLRESKWGIYGFVTSLLLFWFGLVFTMFSIYLSDEARNPVMLGMTIALATIGLLGLIYVVWLGTHYRATTKTEEIPIVTVTKNGIAVQSAKSDTVINGVRVINTGGYEISVKDLSGVRFKRGELDGKHKSRKHKR